MKSRHGIKKKFIERVKQKLYVYFENDNGYQHTLMSPYKNKRGR